MCTFHCAKARARSLCFHLFWDEGSVCIEVWLWAQGTWCSKQIVMSWYKLDQAHVEIDTADWDKWWSLNLKCPAQVHAFENLVPGVWKDHGSDYGGYGNGPRGTGLWGFIVSLHFLFFCCLLCVDEMWSVSFPSLLPYLPTVTDSISLELFAKIKPLSPKLLSVMVFYQSSKGGNRYRRKALLKTWACSWAGTSILSKARKALGIETLDPLGY